MPVTALRDKYGFTMIEFLMALCVLTIGMLGLLEAANLAMKHDKTNNLRTFAITIVDRELAADQARGFDNINTTPEIKSVKIAGTIVNYTVTKTAIRISSGNTANVTVNVSWNDRGQTRNYSASTSISNR